MRKGLSGNIKFSYLFRDSGNYKTFGYVVLSNPGGKTPEEFDGELRQYLIDGAYFYPEKIELPLLRNSEEGMWHEYEKSEVTEEKKTDERTIDEVVSLLRTNTVII